MTSTATSRSSALLSAETEHLSVPGACKISANDLAGAEVHFHIELAPAADDFRQSRHGRRAGLPRVVQIVPCASQGCVRTNAPSFERAEARTFAGRR
jgi:hypothetical protein